MEKKFEKPELTIIEFFNEDIVTTSDFDSNPDWPEDEALG